MAIIFRVTRHFPLEGIKYIFRVKNISVMGRNNYLINICGFELNQIFECCIFLKKHTEGKLLEE